MEILASLSLGEDDEDDPQILQEGIAPLVPMLGPRNTPDSSPSKQSKKQKHLKYAEKCMYAELLEFSRDSSLNEFARALPSDLQTNWIALSPVPKGKRCLAVAHVSHGNPGSGQIYSMICQFS